MFTAYQACIRFTIYLRYVATNPAECLIQQKLKVLKQRIHTLYARLLARSGPEGYSRSLGSASLPPLTYHVTFIKVRVCLCQPKCKYLDIADLAEAPLLLLICKQKLSSCCMTLACLSIVVCRQMCCMHQLANHMHS